MTPTQDIEATRAAFAAIRGTDEDAVRRRFAVLDLTPERMGEAEFEEAVRDEVRRLESSGSTSTLVGLRPSMPAMSKLQAEARETPATDPEPPARAPAACAWCGDARMVVTTRDPADPAFGTAVPCPRCVSLEERARLAGVPPRFVSAVQDEPDRGPGKRAAVEFALAWDLERSVVLASASDGPTAWGTGKTHLACLMLFRALGAGRPGRFLYVSDYLDEVKRRFDGAGEQAEAYTARVAAEPLLVVDDLGGERGTDWQREMLRSLIDRRYRAGRTTVITTNCTRPADVGELLGGAVASRLREYAWVPVGGRDMRGEAR